MTRNTAAVILAAFGAGAIAVGWWGLSDIIDAAAAARACRTVEIDTSAFWLFGCVGIFAIGVLGLVRSERAHRFLLSASLVVFFGAAFGSWLWLDRVLDAQGYRSAEQGLPLFSLTAITLQPSDCVAREA